jgi:L-ribulose-5-phosphate 3-epimerase
MKRPNTVSAFGCNTYSYTLALPAGDCLRHLAGLGFTELELMMVSGHLWPSELDSPGRKALRQHIGRLGVNVVTLNTPMVDMNLAGLAPETRRATLDQIIGIVGLAGDLEVPGVIITPGKANPLFPAPRDRLEGYFLTALDELCPLAKKAGTAIWVENVPFAFLPKISDLMVLLERYGNPDVGIVCDAANCHFAHEDPAQALRKCRSRLKLVHLSDTNRWRYRHDAVGLGTVPFKDLPAVLTEIGYTGRGMLEVISDDPDRDILESVRRLTEMGFQTPQPGRPKRTRAKKTGQ